MQGDPTSRVGLDDVQVVVSTGGASAVAVLADASAPGRHFARRAEGGLFLLISLDPRVTLAVAEWGTDIA